MSTTPRTLAVAAALAAVLAASAPRFAAADGLVEPPGESERLAQTETVEPQAPQAPSLNAKIVSPGAPGAPGTAQDSAQVQVKVTGVESPLLQYKVDDGPAFETSDTTVRLRDLKPGPHKVSVLLEGKDGAALGPSQTLDINVP